MLFSAGDWQSGWWLLETNQSGGQSQILGVLSCKGWMVFRWLFPYSIAKWFMIRHVGFQPPTRGILEAILHLGGGRGFAPLTKDSRSYPLTSYTIRQHGWHGIHDPGVELTGQEFQTLLQKCHIRDVCTTAKNPQYNVVCKRMHQMIGHILRTLLHGGLPQDMASTKEYINEALSIAGVVHA